MNIKPISDSFFVSNAITVDDLPEIAHRGIKTIICNRPDDEESTQASFSTIERRAIDLGISCRHLPVSPNNIDCEVAVDMANELETAETPVLGYCRSGLRSMTLWAAGKAIKQRADIGDVAKLGAQAGYDVKQTVRRLVNVHQNRQSGNVIDIVIVGGGAAGVAAASSILSRTKALSIVIIEPSGSHYYQPGWTMVGAGVFNKEQILRPMQSVIPKGVTWSPHAVTDFMPACSSVVLDNGDVLSYANLVVAAGLKLDWESIPGLSETLGKNGVTSNYRYDLAPYTWELVNHLKVGKAIFTQPPMPIKCAGAPQKALYLSADNWLRKGCLDDVDIEFCSAAPTLFGVEHYVPALMSYVKRYKANLSFKHNLIKVDGPNKKAWFEVINSDGKTDVVERAFDMLHVCPPQSAPDFVKKSPIADESGWVDVDAQTLQHQRYTNIWGIGDVTNTPNAKTAAAARAQAPVLACNLLSSLGLAVQPLNYQGYGSCPLTVELGKVILAEFGYGGELMPSFPTWLLDGKTPSFLSWTLKKSILPELYWRAMLKGREWLVATEPRI